MASSQKIQKAKCQNLNQSLGASGSAGEKQEPADPEEKLTITQEEGEKNVTSAVTSACQILK